ncbi:MULTISPECIES: hypothetical protein [Streptomyces]|uniref:hypothetical protein n=1 Tax=Streptomyces TaxID=1883 RepID=UPI001031D921|nr:MULTISPECIES: hypothetical protein [Streptomyces]
MRVTGVVRAIRATVFAGVCVVLALVGHVHMSGSAVPPLVALGAFAGVAVATWACAGVGRGPMTVALAAIAVQGGLHLAFSLGQSAVSPRPGAAVTSPVQDLALSLMCGGRLGQPPSHAEAVEVVTAAGLAVPGHGGHGHGAVGHHAADAGAHAAAGAAHLHSGGMLAAHLGAAVLSGLWLAWGERVTCDLLFLLGVWLAAPMRLIRLWSAPVPRLPGPVCLPATEVPALRARLLLHTLISRGPPRHWAVG